MSAIHLTTGAFPKVKALDRPVLIDFWASWCGPCRTQGPILDQVAAHMGDRAVVAKVNVDEEPELAAAFGVQSIPTLVVLKGDQIGPRMVGVQQATTLVRALETLEA
jgi:thioredoxin 1